MKARRRRSIASRNAPARSRNVASEECEPTVDRDDAAQHPQTTGRGEKPGAVKTIPLLFSDNVAKRGTMANAEQEVGLEPISFNYIFSVLWRRRIMIIGAASAMLLAALIYLILAPTRYTATASIVLDVRHLPLVQNETAVEPQQDNDAAVESHTEMIKSASVAAIVLKKLNLADDAEFVGPTLLERWFGNVKTEDSQKEALGTAVRRFGNGLRVSRTATHGYVVAISYTSLDPQKAALIANATAEAYIEDQLQAKFEATNRASQWLQQRIAELRTQATDAFKSIQDFKSQNNLIVDSDGTLETDVELKQLTESLAKARAETALAQSRLADIEAVLSPRNSEDGLPDATVTDALNNSVITKLRQQYLDDKKRAIDWAARYGRTHDAVAHIQSEMATLRREIHEEMERIGETYKSELKVARSREQTIEKRLTEVFQNNSANRQSQVKLQDLETAANSYRSTYEKFLSRYTQAVQQQSFPSTEARIITSAGPGRKTSPKVMLTLGLAILGGVGLGMAAAFIREQIDRRVYARDQLVRGLGVNCISAVPASERAKKSPQLALSAKIRSWGSAARLMQPITQQEGPNPPTLLYNGQSPFSPACEALRNIKVALDMTSGRQDTRTLGLVSALPGEGKSSIAASLAATVAGAGRSVLLIDCDLRNPALTKFFGLHNCAGVLEVLSRRANIDNIVKHNRQYHFDFLCGPTIGRPVHTADLLNSEAMMNILVETKERYDYVVVDLPPILPVIDVRACSHLFDTFALVVEWGRTNIADLVKAFSIAPIVHERLLGVVLNKVDTETMHRIEGYGYPTYGHYV